MWCELKVVYAFEFYRQILDTSNTVGKKEHIHNLYKILFLQIVVIWLLQYLNCDTDLTGWFLYFFTRFTQDHKSKFLIKKISIKNSCCSTSYSFSRCNKPNFFHSYWQYYLYLYFYAKIKYVNNLSFISYNLWTNTLSIMFWCLRYDRIHTTQLATLSQMDEWSLPTSHVHIEKEGERTMLYLYVLLYSLLKKDTVRNLNWVTQF